MGEAARAKRDDAERRRATPAHYVEYGLVRALLAFFRLVGIEAASAISGGALRAIGPLIAPISKRADDNLRLIHPDWTKGRRRAVIADIWENLGRTAGEFAHLEKLGPEGGRVEIEGQANILRVIASERPAIFVSGHFANWEVMSVCLQKLGLDHAVVYRRANNPLVDRLIQKERAKTMSPDLVPKGKRGGRAIIDVMKRGASLAMLVDQKLTDGIAAPFLGREAMTAPAAARLSLKYKAPVLPVSVERVKGTYFRIVVHPAIALDPSGDATKDVLDLTIRVNQALEHDILARPGQWLWMHRRWKVPRA